MTRNEQIVSQGLLKELMEKELLLVNASMALDRAKAAYDVEVRKYAAIRDATQAYLERSPYAPDVVWPTTPNAPKPPVYRGRFRFVRMPVGDAVLELLREAQGPMSREVIHSLFMHGGGDVENMRSINAALVGLVKGGRVVRTPEGHYLYKEEEVDPGELPFG